jgi:thiamine pyrophosphate-dependent acetolactate synthase large subunit-like protein
MRTAIERRGVAVVVIPGEVFLSESPTGWTVRPIEKTESVFRPDDVSLAKAAEVLNRSKAVTILAGAGCAGAHDQLIAIAAALRAPVLHTLRGKEFVEFDNPYDGGMTGLIGWSSGYRAMEHCDALLMLGTDFPYRSFYPDDVPVIQVDVRGEQIGRRVAVDIGLVGTVRDTIEALLPKLAAKADSEHLDRITAHNRRARARLDDLATDSASSSPLHPQFVAGSIDRLASGDAIFTADVGTPTIWAARYLHMNGRRRLLGSFNHGSMANALPQGIGAQASHPGRQVVVLAGDGGVAMLLGELITLRQMHLPVKVIVFNNGDALICGTRDESRRCRQLRDGSRQSRLRRYRPGDRSIWPVCGEWSGARGGAPGCIRTRGSRARRCSHSSTRTKVTLEQDKGFGLFTMRTILSGGGERSSSSPRPTCDSYRESDANGFEPRLKPSARDAPSSSGLMPTILG